MVEEGEKNMVKGGRLTIILAVAALILTFLFGVTGAWKIWFSSPLLEITTLEFVATYDEQGVTYQGEVDFNNTGDALRRKRLRPRRTFTSVNISQLPKMTFSPSVKL